ncbi:uncharacterized protein LOC8261699 [Ricinus communis]|uniref:Uncharacterized protein n=1 Tax=Ricinus communis TaxID=3988 RepID=B9T533_RICCO|nr:uncharacterized protein LOC8261699 [Ricinus communis]EEF29037.1 conserved hypothetical protein [Ricinus communis]|eukprot:XP_002533352.1 uncharacterized protein LOC8261699 [Ricinus communis]
MEGLLPLVYKAIKRNRTRRQYECLSSGAAFAYNPADFYISDAETTYTKPSSIIMEKNNAGTGRSKLHRRSYSSVEDLSVTGSSRRRTAGASPPRKQLVRFRSQRMFSCVTGC